MSDLLGAHEAAELLGLSRQALHSRRQAADFPHPVAQLAAGPVWTREQLVEYATGRTQRFHERPAIEQLARDELTLEEAAELLNTTPGQLRAFAASNPAMPGRWRLGTGELQAIGRDDLGVYARALGATLAETAVLG